MKIGRGFFTKFFFLVIPKKKQKAIRCYLVENFKLIIFARKILNMKKIILVAVISLIGLQCFSQSSDSVNLQKVNFGLLMPMSFNNSAVEESGYTFFDNDKSFTDFPWTLYLRFQTKKLNYYPFLSASFSKNTFLLNNLKGDFLPEGADLYLPYKTVGNGWTLGYSSNSYLRNTSDYSQSQFAFGSLFTHDIGSGFELGLGIAAQVIHYKITDYQAYDEYDWAYSTSDSKYDVYSYTSTTDFANDNPKIDKTIIKPYLPLCLIYRNAPGYGAIGGILTVNIITPTPSAMIGFLFDLQISKK